MNTWPQLCRKCLTPNHKILKWVGGHFICRRPHSVHTQRPKLALRSYAWSHSGSVRLRFLLHVIFSLATGLTIRTKYLSSRWDGPSLFLSRCSEEALPGTLFTNTHSTPTSSQAAVMEGHLEFWLSRSHCNQGFLIFYTANLQKAMLVSNHRTCFGSWH